MPAPRNLTELEADILRDQALVAHPRAPWLEPMAEKSIAQLMKTHISLTHWQCARSHKVSSGFYKSKAMEWVRA